MRQFMLVFVMASLGPATWGCKGRQEPSAAIKSAATPRAAATNMFKAMLDGNKADFLACLVGTENEMKAPQAGFDLVQAEFAFRDAIIKTYGQEGWEKFQGEMDANGHTSFDLPDRKDLDLIEKAELKMEGSSAILTVSVANSHEKLFLTNSKEGKGWKIKAISFIPPGAEPVKLASFIQENTRVYERYRKAIGKHGITPEDIDAEMDRELMAKAFGISTTQPHRFNIDEIK